MKRISSERELLSKCLSNDKHAWDEFVQRYTKLIFSLIYRTLEFKGYRIEKDLVSDLHQDVFLSVLKDDYAKLRRFKWKNGCSLATWIGVITRNLVLNFIRSNSKQKYLTKSLDESFGNENEKQATLLDVIKNPAPNAKEVMNESEMIDLLNASIEKLEITERVILDLFYAQTLPLEEIGRVLNKSEDAVFMQKKRVLAKLQEIMKKGVGFR